MVYEEKLRKLCSLSLKEKTLKGDGLPERDFSED